MLLCVGNGGKRKLKVQLLVNSRNLEKALFRVFPEVAVLERVMVYEFDVFVAPLCSCTLEVEVLLVAKRRNGTTQTKRVGVCFETELTTKLEYDDVICDNQIGEGGFGVVFK